MLLFSLISLCFLVTLYSYLALIEVEITLFFVVVESNGYRVRKFLLW